MTELCASVDIYYYFICTLSSSLSTHSTFSLNGNEFRDEGAGAIGEALKHNKSLTTLK
jgi:hypothetical protein